MHGSVPVRPGSASSGDLVTHSPITNGYIRVDQKLIDFARERRVIIGNIPHPASFVVSASVLGFEGSLYEFPCLHSKLSSARNRHQ